MKHNLINLIAKRVVTRQSVYPKLSKHDQDAVRGTAWKEAAGWTRRWQWPLVALMYGVCVLALLAMFYFGNDFAIGTAAAGSLIVGVAVMVVLAEWGVVEAAVRSAQHAMFWRRVARHANSTLGRE